MCASGRLNNDLVCNEHSGSGILNLGIFRSGGLPFSYPTSNDEEGESADSSDAIK